MSNGSPSALGTGLSSSTFEDCPTNVFQIAELNGLKWCALASDTKIQNELDSSSSNEEEDQIVRAYTECLEADVLCTWRRRPPTAGINAAYLNPTPNQDDQKEIWLFWYAAEEPQLVKEFKSRGMIELTHNESVEADRTEFEFEYETRTLFFKALNGAIERRLLLEGYIRFGRWLCRPLKMNFFKKYTIPKFINAIRFNYFLHRDSLVCASISIQRQPTIICLSQCHLKENRFQPVILGPWSIRAQLLPDQVLLFNNDENDKNVNASHQNKESKEKLKQFIEKQFAVWRRIYPALDIKSQNADGLPDMLLVQLNGKSMLYPTAFIGILADEQLPPIKTEESCPNEKLLDDCPSTSNKEENAESNSRIKRERRRMLSNLAIARTSFGDSCLRFPGTAGKKVMESDNKTTNGGNECQKSDNTGCISEFNYDYMRREFCYCRICPQIGHLSILQQENKQQTQDIPNPDIHANNLYRLPFHRNMEKMQKYSQLLPFRDNKNKKYNEPKKERRKNNAKWIVSLTSPNENCQKLQQQIKKEQWDQKNSIYGKYRARIAQQQELMRNVENIELASTSSETRITQHGEYSENNNKELSELEKMLEDHDEEENDKDGIEGENRHWRSPLFTRKKRKYSLIEETKAVKRIKWPCVAQFDVLNIAFEEEDSDTFAINPCNSLPPMSNNGEMRQTNKAQSLLMQLLLSPNTMPIHEQEYPNDQNEREIIDENANAATPAYHNESGGEQMETNEMEESSQNITSPSTTVNTPYQQQQHTPQFLSPPASNENATMIAVVNPPMPSNPNTHVSFGQTYQSSISMSANTASLIDSMSKIYPTPPTPMQQFSPLNMLQQHHPSINEEGVITTISYFSDQLKNLPWTKPLYGAIDCQKAHTREFCRRLCNSTNKNDDGFYDGNNIEVCNPLHEGKVAGCDDCVGMRHENEQDHSQIHRTKRSCCEPKSSNHYHSQPNGAYFAIQLHSNAQRRSAADANLELRLHKEELTRYQRVLDDYNNQQWPAYWPNQGSATPFPLNQQQFNSQMTQQINSRPTDFMNQFPPQMPSDQNPAIYNSGNNTPTQLAKQTLQRNSSKIALLNSPSNSISLTPTSSAMTIAGRPSNRETNAIHQQLNNRNLLEHLQIMQFDKSSMITFLIQDTIADLHYDIVFDACPLCCCNSNIRSYELGFYIIGPTKLLSRCDQLQQKQRQQQLNQYVGKQWSGFRIPTPELQKCICGFSAVRHRYLCGPGLFPDDIEEACGSIIKPNKENAARLLQFNPSDITHIRIIDLLRHQMLNRDINSLTRSNDIAQLWRNQKTDIKYVQSPIDVVELNKLIEEIFKNYGIPSMPASNNGDISTLHPWGYQWADSVGEPRDSECLGIFEELRETLRDPHSPSLVPGYSKARRLEQFTLRTFARNKNIIIGNKDEENSRPEPIPSLIALSNIEREFVLLQPPMIRHWEQLELMPVEQPKDLLYLALVPDINVVAEKCKIFMEEMTNIYERRCRLGTHIRISVKETPRDAIFRVGRSISPNINIAMMHSINELFAKSGIAIGNQNLEQIKNYVELCLHELTQFFTDKESIFERRVYLESAYRQQQSPLSTSLASPPDANAMPPPAVPGNMFASNGPASATASAGGNSTLNESIAGPGSASAYSPNLVHIQRQQQSPSAGNGPNSAPNLQGISISNAAENAGSTQFQSGGNEIAADDLTKREDKMPKEQVDLLLAKESPQLPHTIVIYIINPFGQQLGSRNDPGESARHLGTLATAALFCAWNEFILTIPFKRRTQLQLEIIPLRDIYDYTAFVGMGNEHLEANYNRERMSAWDSLRRLAFTIYSQPRLLHPEIAMGALSKNMTHFGTAERMKELFQMLGENPLFIKKNCSPFLLAPNRSINFINQSNNSSNSQSGGSQSISANGQKLQLFNTEERVLLITYCLLPDEEMLCASVTDERGSLLDTTLINLAISPLPPAEPQKEWRHKQRHSQIADALHRLWQFIQSVILCQEVHQWRLIISRMGKLGHGEFKIWNELLSKRNLRAYNSSLKNCRLAFENSPSDGLFISSNCSACTNSYGWQETPAILSACLISTEPEPHVRVFNGMALNGGDGQIGSIGTNMGAGGIVGSAGNSGIAKIGGSKNLGKQSMQAQQWQQQAPEDRSLTHIVVFPTILNVSLQQQEDMLHGGMDEEFPDFFFSGDGAPDGMGELVDDLVFEAKNEEEAPIDNQPMAIGFTISTAPVWACPQGELNSGLSAFWSNCSPAVKQRRLAHLKSSLHINSTNLLQTDEYQQQSTATTANKVGGSSSTSTIAASEQQAPHPLDLANTDEVLRYVLETQNALSWLSLDSVTGSRCSCLPINMQAVLRLAQAIGSFFGKTNASGTQQ